MSNKKIALVTGGTSGVGMSIAKELAEKDFSVHFIGTNRERGQALEADLNQIGGSDCRFIELDLSSLRATKEFAIQFGSEVPRLDVLLNVAGVMLRERQQTAEGIEKTFAIDYLSAYVLSRELVPLLSNANHARILNVSGAPSQVLKPRLDFENMAYRQNYSGMGVAVDAVHAKTVMTEILAGKLTRENIDVNAFHPGWVKSNLASDLPGYMRTLFSIMGPFMSKGSKSGNLAATSDAVTGVTGQLFVKTTPRPLSFDQAYKDQLSSWTSETVGNVLGAGGNGR